MNQIDFTEEELAALKKEHAANATDEQFKLWIAECRNRNLAPVRDIIMQVRTSEEWDPEIRAKVKKKKSIYIVTIGAKRKIANATGLYAGQLPTKWIYLDKDGQPSIESEIPLADPTNKELPLEPWACRTSILRTGFQTPLTVVSRFGAYAQTMKRNDQVQLTSMWSMGGRGVEMLEKCSESQCLTRAFPSELSGLYVKEELQREEVLESIPVAAEAVIEAPKAAIVPTVNHAPATPTNEPRPEEKPRRRTLDEALPNVVKEFVGLSKPKKEAKDTKIEEVILDKVEVVVENQTSTVENTPETHAEVEKPVQKMDKPANERARDLIKAGVNKDNFKTYALLQSGAGVTSKITKDKWAEILDKLESLLASGGKDAVNDFIVQTPEKEEEPF